MSALRAHVPPELVVFDVDGTLHDTFRWWSPIIRAGLQQKQRKNGIGQARPAPHPAGQFHQSQRQRRHAGETDVTAGPEVAGEPEHRQIDNSGQRETVFVVQFPKPGEGGFLAVERRHEFPLIHIRVREGVSDHENQGLQNHQNPNTEQNLPDSAVRSACRRFARGIR